MISQRLMQASAARQANMRHTPNQAYASQWRRRYMVWLVGGTLIVGMGVVTQYLRATYFKNPSLPTGVRVGVANAASGEKQLTLTISQEGEISLASRPIALADLPARLQAYKSQSKEPKVVINADGGANYAFVVSVLDEIRKSGISNVGITTEKSK